ncbi:MAG: multiheme c-type cytochrome [Pseudomonadota bacterium]
MSTKPRRKYVPAVGPKLRKLLYVVFGLFALLAVNAFYLSSVTMLEWYTGRVYQDYFYQYMFLGHLVLGLIIILPVVIYGIIHMSNTRNRVNKRAIKVGYALFTTALLLLASGLVLTRGIPLVEIRDADMRQVAYWLHVITPLVAAWLFVLHRLAGKRINWRAGGAVAAFALVLAGVALAFQTQDPRRWNEAGPESGEQYFFPSLARTSTGNFIPARSLMNDEYCAECHNDVHERWEHSSHHIASFNNPVYLMSVRNTRQVALERDGNVQAARFCAGCHDLVPFFSGAFDDPNFDDVNHPTSQAGITCTGCHAITHVNSVRGNADYTIEEPQHYPFAFSDSEALQWVNRTLVKAKPDFHKKTFLKPLHESTEFCGTCHKVHLPEELNNYKWLRGQNHYDSFLLSGVSGHGSRSFYYPPKAHSNCNQCHMEALESDDFGARDIDGNGTLQVHDHLFPSANTAMAQMKGAPEWVQQAHRDILQGSLRVDIFGLKADGAIDGELTAPLRPSIPALVPGESYLLETVVRTLTLGHHFTQGTADSNEVWVEVKVTSGDRVLGHSGARRNSDGTVDPWAHFINAYVLDSEGNRINRRNAEDIFTVLYNNQIPPGGADTVHYRFMVPEDVIDPVAVEVQLHYRKFDTEIMSFVIGEGFERNDLPITTIASDRIEFPLDGAVAGATAPEIPEWQRWNDYGIGLLRKGGTGELRQAEAAFARVEALGRADGAVNLARVFLREGRLDEAADALARASSFDPPAPPWTVAWLTGEVNRQNGYLDEALENFTAVADTQFAEARDRGFDFSRDYRLLNTVATTLFDRAKLERGERRSERRADFLAQSADWYQRALVQDPENTTAHYGLSQVYTLQEQPEMAAEHRALHEKYRVDDNGRDRAVANARRANPAADHAANAVVIYDVGPAFE